MKTNKGFSLVELIVVIAIMAIIAAVAIPVYNVYLDKANKAADEQLLADIMDVLTYAVAADTTLDEGYIGSVILGGDEASFKTDGTFVSNALAEAGLTNLKLKYNDWDASQTGNANVIAGSTFFGGNTKEEREEKVENLLNNVQTLVTAVNNVSGSTTLGGEIVFAVTDSVSQLDQNKYNAIVDLWGSNLFSNETSDYYKTESTGLTSNDDMVLRYTIYYANLKAAVMFIESKSTAQPQSLIDWGLANSSETAKTITGATFLAYTNALATTTSGTMAYGLLDEMFTEVIAMMTADDETLFDEYKNLSEATRKDDAKAFLSTLTIANSKKDDFDTDMDFSSDEMVDYINSNIETMNKLSVAISNGNVSIPSTKPSVVISAVKSSDGSVSFVIYK